MSNLAIRTDMKLIPISNPNYLVRESAQELIEILKRGLTYVLNDECDIIGFVDPIDEPYEKDGFIYGSILFYINEDIIDRHEWFNAEVMIDKDSSINSIKSVVYKEKINE